MAIAPVFGATAARRRAAVLLAVALARRGAAEGALTILTEVVRPGEFRRCAVEMLAELAEDAGQPVFGLEQVVRLVPQSRTGSGVRCGAFWARLPPSVRAVPVGRGDACSLAA